MRCKDSPLGKWLAQHGGQFHPNLEFRNDDFGTSVYAAETLPAQAQAVTCPFSLAITPALVRANLASLLPVELADHAAMILYLVLHKMYPPPEIPPNGAKLEHWPYVDMLPPPQSLTTPLHFTEDERHLLAGTNLFGAVNDREDEWKKELERVGRSVKLDKTIDWETWLWGCTMLSSRAFPSSLIDGDKNNASPVLFPGVDMLNHSLSVKATWTSSAHTPDGSLSLSFADAVNGDNQVFNNYGPKPNEELLLGYGFTTPENRKQGDVVALKIAIPPWKRDEVMTVLEAQGIAELRHLVKADGIIPDAMVEQIRLLIKDGDDIDGQRDLGSAGRESGDDGHRKCGPGWYGWRVERDAYEMLGQMILSKLDAQKQAEAKGHSLTNIRPRVRAMIDEYREGQEEILAAVLETAGERLEGVYEAAAAEGYEFSDEEDQEEDES